MPAEHERRAEWLQTALTGIGLAVIEVDSRGAVQFMSPVAEKLTGWPQGEAAGLPVATIFRIEDEATRLPAPDPVAAVLESGVPIGLADHIVLIACDGTEYRIDQGADVSRDAAGTVVGAVLVFCDVSERQRVLRTADVLALSEVRYRRLFETAQDGILLVDPVTRQVFDANPFLTALLGYGHDELVGKELWEIGLFRDIAGSKAAFQELQQKGYIRYEDLPLQTKDGRHIEVEFVSNVYDVGPERVIQCNIRDITDRKRAEHAVQAAHAELEARVRDRTADLARANGALTDEIARRERAEANQRELRLRLASAQEDERLRIARELHDQMGQHLTALALGLKVIKDTTPDPSPVREGLQHLQALTDRIGQEVHDLALELRPTALDDLGLQAALANYAEEWAERSGVAVDYQSAWQGADRLPAPVETALYRVAQEALTNVLKHAAARRVSVVLQRSPGQASVLIEDDGQGFDPESHPGAGRALGILGMHERAVLLGGTLTIESGPGRGTTVIARVPLPNTEDGHVREIKRD